MGNEKVSRMPYNTAAIQTIELLGRRWLSKSAFEIGLSRPPSFEYEAGQTIRLIHKSLKRYYSFISTPDDPNFTRCVQQIAGGQLSPILACTEPGYLLQITGPNGYFTFKSSDRMPVLISTGTGVAPFVCFDRYRLCHILAKA